MWLENLKELKKEKGMTSKQIAEVTNLPERTVKRIFSGDTDNPYVDTLHRIVTALGGSLDGILADTKVVVGNEDLRALQAENLALVEQIEALTLERDKLIDEQEFLTAEASAYKQTICGLSAEVDLLRLKLEHKEELLALHNYYSKYRT